MVGRSIPRHFLGALIILVLLLSAIAIEASDNFTVNHGANQSITAYSECRQVTNNSATGLSVYIPTQTQAEWQSFYTNPPAGVTANSCGCELPWGGTIAEGSTITAYQSGASPACTSEVRTCTNGVLSGSYQYGSCTATCAGVYVGGYCWYVGAKGKSCDSVCASHGSCNLSGTKNYVGSGGSVAKCKAVGMALGFPGTIWNSSGGHAANLVIGCVYHPVNKDLERFGESPTTCGATNTAVQRICACNN